MSIQRALEELIEKGHVEFGGMKFDTNREATKESFRLVGTTDENGPIDDLIARTHDFAACVYSELTDHDVLRMSLDCDFDINLHMMIVTARVTHAMS
jgi:hypothetical protein